MGCLEDLFFKSKEFDKLFYKEGILTHEINFNVNNLISNPEKYIVDESMFIYLLNKKGVDNLIKNIFSKKIQQLLFKLTGFKYSIDYLRIYENNHVKKEGQFKNFREAHYDKSFSRNMLKIFIPLNVSINSGPLKVFYKNSNKKNLKDQNQNFHKLLIGNGEIIYGVLPNSCWHQEGNPERNFSSKQVMFQLNPANCWQYREDLYKRQKNTENKFSSFSFLFSKNQLLD